VSQPLRVLIVDDEPLARARIAELLAEQPGVQIVGEATNGDGAIAEIRELDPDLVFLDVQMPGRTGLDVVKEIGAEQMPHTIFVTAYDQYAVAAFDSAAVDYLVKPFDDERFERAFARARRVLQLEQVGELAQRLRGVLDAAAPAPGSAVPAATYLERIAVESRGQLRVVSVADVDYIAAAGPYVMLHTRSGRFLVRERMQALEQRLDPAVFIRVHRSTIVRLERIAALSRAGGGDYAVRLHSGAELKVSRGRVEELERRLSR
jgi:two-component system LytT family response regulator